MIQVDAAKVKAARESAGLSVEATARIAKINRKTVEAYEGRGDLRPPANPTLEVLVVLARAYRCSPRDFAVDPAQWDALAAEIGAMFVAPTPLPHADVGMGGAQGVKNTHA